MRVSKSNKVCGYVKAVQRYRKLSARLREKDESLSGLRAEVRDADLDVHTQRLTLTGGQLGEAARILGRVVEEECQ